jgi:hypothetical protein
MKHNVVAVIFAALIVGMTSTVRADDPVGRYLLMPATVEVTGYGPTTQDRMLFKIDTVTGQAWFFLDGKIQGKPVSEWIEIDH